MLTKKQVGLHISILKRAHILQKLEAQIGEKKI